jgi:Tfp pilus assembly protein PilV
MDQGAKEMSHFTDALKALGITLLLLLIGGLVIGVGFLGLQAMFGPSDEQRAKDRVPAVVSSADGCTVYKFYDSSSWHYFTKCGGTVTTTKNYTESCGKGCSRPRTESLTTEGN